MIDRTPIALHGDDVVEDDSQPVAVEDVLSAVTEAQILELLGKLGGIRSVLLRVLGDPNRRSQSPESRAIRTALGLANEGVQIAQAVTMSTTRAEVSRGRR